MGKPKCAHCYHEISPSDFNYYANLPFETRGTKKGEEAIICDDCDFALKFSQTLIDQANEELL